ncbi:glyoxalase [Aureimonas sp. SA4125]|uniref:VOC family protein n=1 Tax=Aureimonas sp. SA4125 TaxID=2826993 RepID=UPI001CC5C280|nr:VOC family protein [Aureimonas sp. SA4125]BDA85339.1 glyoxalase [Aureimonas sp. SA4125]
MLRPFVPAKNYDRSRQFYEALGFVAGLATDRITVMAHGDDGFLLQNFYQKDLAENLMIQLAISDLAGWWQRHDPEQVAARFGAKPPSGPALQPWGLVVGFVHDPSGVLWHFTQVAR